ALNNVEYDVSESAYAEDLEMKEGAMPRRETSRRADAVMMDKAATYSGTADDAGGMLMPEKPSIEEASPPPLRTDFRETAFFFPDLLTDRDGAVVLCFTVPDALTRWKVLGLAHTTDLKIGRFTKEALTSKPLMTIPNLPRFL